MKITEPTARGGTGNTYWYTWNPCHIEECPGYPAGTDIAVSINVDTSLINCTFSPFRFVRVPTFFTTVDGIANLSGC